MLEELKQIVYEENLKLKKYNLITLTWGNVSGIDRDKGLVVIKPSGVSYDILKPSDMVVTDLEGNIVEGKLNPSSDLKTHLYLYKHFPHIKGVVHTHSTFATAFAQANIPLLPFGTTHADTFYGTVPVTRGLKKEEIENDYELNTGKVIVETFKSLDYEAIPGVLVSNHGPFTWGASPSKAVENALILENIAHMAVLTKILNPNEKQTLAPQYLLDKHYFRKHGKNAYYGQKEKK